MHPNGYQVIFIVSPSTIDKMFEIYTFFENRTEIYTFFENRFEIYTCILFENRTENFEHFVNGRWTHYKPQKCALVFFKTHILVPWDPLGYFWGPILGPNCGMFSKLDGPGPLGSKGYPQCSEN